MHPINRARISFQLILAGLIVGALAWILHPFAE